MTSSYIYDENLYTRWKDGIFVSRQHPDPLRMWHVFVYGSENRPFSVWTGLAVHEYGGLISEPDWCWIRVISDVG